MAQTKTPKAADVSIVSAIETLSSIADLELSSTLQDPLMIAPPPKEAPVMVKTVRWLHQKNAERMHSIIREKLHVILNYLKHFYASERERFARKESIEGIRTIMMLVDEASENLDRYTKLFLGAHSTSVKETKEFMDLCNFYERKILPIAVHRKVSSLISALPIAEILQKAGVSPPEWPTKIAYAPLTVELAGIQSDEDYELLLLRKTDGSRFFTPKLIRSMHLACDIEQAVDWQGRLQLQAEIAALKKGQAATEANFLVSNCYPLLDAFFHAAHRANDNQLVLDLYSPCIALMMAALQAIHRSESLQAKGILEYTDDFRTLFNQFIHSSEFKRLLTYPTTNEHSWEFAVLKATESLCSNIIDGTPLSLEFVNGFKALLAKGMGKAEEEIGAPNGTLSHTLNLNFAALRSLIGTRGDTTIARMLHELEVRPFLSFEPLVGESLPTNLFALSWRGDLIPIVRLPSPTKQELIDRATPSEVFQIAARRHGRSTGKFIIVNLQDRTGWKDGARCQAIEELSRDDEMKKSISILSLPCDGDFYLQEGSYEDLSNADQFKEELLDHMTEPARGVLFPRTFGPKVGGELKELIDALHVAMFGGAKELSQAERHEFIDLIHVLLILRAVEEVHPDIIFICSKDSIDRTLVTIGNLFSFLKLINHRPSSNEEKDWLGATVLGLPLLHRDRLLFANRYTRMTTFIRFLEEIAEGEDETRYRTTLNVLSKFLPQEILLAAMLPASGHQPTYLERR